MINKYLFLNYRFEKSERLNSYDLFKQDKFIELYRKDVSAEKEKKNIRIEWNNLPSKDRKKYKDIKIRNNKFLDEEENITKMTGLYYFQKYIFKNNSNKISALESVKEWKSLTPKNREILNKKTTIVNIKNERLFDIKNLINCDKPKRLKSAKNLYNTEIKKKCNSEIIMSRENLTEKEKKY